MSVVYGYHLTDVRPELDLYLAILRPSRHKTSGRLTDNLTHT